MNPPVVIGSVSFPMRASALALIISLDTAARKVREFAKRSDSAEPKPEPPRSILSRQPGAKRNGLCPCGSGTKFKRCCRRVAPCVTGGSVASAGPGP